MSGIKSLVALSFAAAVGLTFLFLACALHEYGTWWPLFVLFFYVLAPVPCICVRRFAEVDSASNAFVETSLFITAVFVISAFGLPLVLAHSKVIALGACALVITGNLVVFATMGAAFFLFSRNDFDYSSW